MLEEKELRIIELKQMNDELNQVIDIKDSKIIDLEISKKAAIETSTFWKSKHSDLKQERDSFEILLNNSESARYDLEQQLEEAKERNAQLTQKYEDMLDKQGKEIEDLKLRNDNLVYNLSWQGKEIDTKVTKLKLMGEEAEEAKEVIRRLARLL